MLPTPVEVIDAFRSALAERNVARARSLLSASPRLRVAGSLGRGGAGFGLSLAALMLGAGGEPWRVVLASGERVVVERAAPILSRGSSHLILALVHVRQGRIASWLEFFDEQLFATNVEPAETQLIERPALRKLLRIPFASEPSSVRHRFEL